MSQAAPENKISYFMKKSEEEVSGTASEPDWAKAQ
jgi:hypothetical protein